MERARKYSVVSSDDWWAVWIGLGFLGASIGLARTLGDRLAEPVAWTANPLDAFDSGPAALAWPLLLAMGAATWLVLWARGKSTASFAWPGYPLVAALTILSKFLGAQTALHGSGLGAAVWAVILGSLVCNVAWWSERPARWTATLDQGLEEFWIKVGLVLLAIDLEAVVDLGYHGLVLAYAETTVVWLLTIVIGRVLLNLPVRVTLITSSALAICGTSAASAVAAAMDVPTGSAALALPIAVMSILTVPVIPVLPVLADWLGFGQAVTGAWIGGSVDTTGAVIASAAIAGPSAIRSAAVVKMLQNTMICIIALIVAALPPPSPTPRPATTPPPPLPSPTRTRPARSTQPGPRH